LKLGDNLVLCQTINPALKYLKVVRGGGEFRNRVTALLKPLRRTVVTAPTLNVTELQHYRAAVCALGPSVRGPGAVQPDHRLVRLLAGHRRLRQGVGALGAEAVEQQIQVAPPGVRGDLAGGLVDPVL